MSENPPPPHDDHPDTEDFDPQGSQPGGESPQGGSEPTARGPGRGLNEAGLPQPLAEQSTRMVDHPIERELAESYLTYSMSTIVDRALPDARDGLKPSQRRILVAMNDLNLTPGRKHSKCAGIVGETMKKYHPHGDQAIYPTLVNLAQDWKTRYLLVDKQGNFGSIDPDPPAAMRYTEARLHRHAIEMLEDLKLETVDWQPNFDESYSEPKVLPAKLPNLLVNGSTGIAVGMACSMPPHNLGEVCRALIALIDNPEIGLPELLELIPGPDFPTGGIICGRRGIVEAYATGRGRITLRARVHHEKSSTGKDLLVVTEIPYQVSKNDGIIQKIGEARKADRLHDVVNLVDESSKRSGMRLVIELRRGADPNVVENQLYQLTPLQTTYSIINIALVRGQPRTLGLKQLMQLYVEHRVEVIRRRTMYRLKQAQQEAHRIEGLIYAVCDIDEVIKLIRSSRSREEAIERLMARGFRIPPDHPYAPQIPERFKAATADQEARLTRVQAEAIGRLQLIQLVGLEIDKLTAEYASLLGKIEEFEAILASDERVLQIIKDDLQEMIDKYADERCTQIEQAVGDFDLGDLTPEETVIVTVTRGGYVKRMPVSEYRTQARGGRGKMGTEIKEGDVTMQMFVSSTHDDLLVFTDRGRVFKLKVYEIPEAGRTSRGRAIVNVLNLQEGEKVREFMTIHDFEKEEAYLLFSTERGLVKRTPLKAYHNVNRAGLIAINLREDDSLIGVTWTSGSDHILLGTSAGMAIRFEEAGARETGRNAMGVKGIDLRGEDRVVGLVRCEPNDQRMLLSVTANGYGKQTPLSDYLVQPEGGEPRPQSRGGKGRRDIATTDRNGEVVCLLAIEPGDDLLLITRNGIIARIPASSVRQTSRGTQGVRVINLGQDDRLAGVARIPAEEAEEAALAQAEEQAGQAPGALEQADIAPDEAPPFGVSPDETLGHEWAEPPADESPADDSEDLDESGDTDLA